MRPLRPLSLDKTLLKSSPPFNLICRWRLNQTNFVNSLYDILLWFQSQISLQVPNKSIQLEVKYLKWWRKQNNSLMKKFRDSESGQKLATSNKIGIQDAEAMLAISKSHKEHKDDEREVVATDIQLVNPNIHDA